MWRFVGILLTDNPGEELIVVILHRGGNFRAHRAFFGSDGVAPYMWALV
jgi:hypothetical protein